MTLALVQASSGLIVILITTWIGLLVSTALLLPGAATRSEQLLTAEPWWCFFRGLGMAVLLVIGLVAAGAPPPIVKLFGFGLLLFVTAVIAVGSAGIIQTIGKRGEPNGSSLTLGMLVRGGLVYSLAIGFPFVGWFVFAPLALISAAGAGIKALVSQNSPAYMPPTPPGSGDYDLSARTGAIS